MGGTVVGSGRSASSSKSCLLGSRPITGSDPDRRPRLLKEKVGRKQNAAHCIWISPPPLRNLADIRVTGNALTLWHRLPRRDGEADAGHPRERRVKDVQL